MNRILLSIGLGMSTTVFLFADGIPDPELVTIRQLPHTASMNPVTVGPPRWQRT